MYTCVCPSSKILKHKHNLLIEAHLYFTIVSLPSVTVTSLSSQQVGQPLTLQCDIVAVRGITNRVDIMWTSNGMIVKRMHGVMPVYMMNTSQVYTDSYIISQLSTNDDGRVYQCEVVVNSSPLITVAGDIVIDVIG